MSSAKSFSIGEPKIYRFGKCPITRRQILDSSKLKEFADDNFKFDENGRKLSKHCGKKEKLLVTSNFSFCHSVFKRLVSQGRQKVSLRGNGLRKYEYEPRFVKTGFRGPLKGIDTDQPAQSGYM